MKINYKRTALSFLENPKMVPLHTPGGGYTSPLTEEQDLKLLYGLQEQFSDKEFAANFSKNIQVCTIPFYEAYQSSRDKLREVVKTTELDVSGTLIMQWPNHTQTFFYRITSNGKDSAGQWEYSAFICLFTHAVVNDSFGLDLLVRIDKTKNEICDLVWKGFADQGRDLSWWVADFMLFLTFLKYAEVETKIIPGNKKDKHIGVKYLNDTNRPVEILDSTYYTTISRTEGFGVRGHFRFQPYGPGMSKKKLIWISDFQKAGYTRSAKILNSPEIDQELPGGGKN